MSRTSAPTVCVIGAGISGLTARKILSDYGIPFVTYDSGDRVGGNWAFKNSNSYSSAYRSVHIDTSKESLRFRDFAISQTYPDFPHHTQVREYLEDCCAADIVSELSRQSNKNRVFLPTRSRGPSRVSRVAARSVLSAGRCRAIRGADRVRCPALVQIADEDRSAPPLPPRRRRSRRAPTFATIPATNSTSVPAPRGSSGSWPISCTPDTTSTGEELHP